MTRLTIFAKGNLDVRDTMHSLRLGDGVAWNGFNEVLRLKAPGVTARVRHETWTRSDALLAADGTVPAALASRAVDLGAHPAAMQFSRALFETEADAIVLSIQPDLYFPLLRHRQEGFLLFPGEWRGWSAEDQLWLRSGFVQAPRLDAEASMSNLERVIARIRERSTAPILVYNFSSALPGETVHAYAGLDETFSTRIRRFNLGLIELSRTTDISIIDVDRIVARGGADRLMLDASHLTAEGCRAVAEEIGRVLQEHGLLPGGEAL